MAAPMTTDGRRVRGRDLRCLLTTFLIERGPLTTARLAELVEAEGFAVEGRASKTVADALRWEIARGRGQRVGRGRHEFSGTSRPTARRVRTRVRELRSEARSFADSSRSRESVQPPMPVVAPK